MESLKTKNMKRLTKAERHKIYKTLLNTEMISIYSIGNKISKIFGMSFTYNNSALKRRALLLPEFGLFEDLNPDNHPNTDYDKMKLQQLIIMFCIEMTRP